MVSATPVRAPVEALFDTALRGRTLVDLTHPLRPGMPVWPGHPEFCQTAMARLENGDISCWHALALGEHTGTHLDAPSHFVRGGWSIERAPLERFFGRMVVVACPDVLPRAAVPADVLAAWERAHGPIRMGDAVFFHFGWDRHWNDDPARFLCDWPGLSGEAAALLSARGARMVGSDCLSIDPFGSADFAAHRTLLGDGILIGENFANLGALPPVCALAALPLPIVDGSGAPLRAIAFVDPPAEQPARG